MQCWDGGEFTYERCCLKYNPSCWSSLHNENVCCTGLFEEHYRKKMKNTTIADRVDLHANASHALVRCIHAFRGTNQRHLFDFVSTTDNNNFIKAAGCVTSLPNINVIVDVFLGRGFTMRAMLDGVTKSRTRPRRPKRSVEVFTMEENTTQIEAAFANEEGLYGWEGFAEILPAKTYLELVYLQQRMLKVSLSKAKVKIWVLVGRFAPFQDTVYHVNALDSVCQHRAPVDVVLIDTDRGGFEDEWPVVELVCKPRWIILHNTNLPDGPNWIQHRMESLGGWQVVVTGHYSLDLDVWANDLRRIRSWSILQLVE